MGTVIITSVTGAYMGKYLYECTVRVIDEDAFPTNKFKAEFHEAAEVGMEALEAVPGTSLMMEYINMAWQSHELWNETVTVLVLDQFKNLYTILIFYLTIYLVDVVLKVSEEAEEANSEERRLLFQFI